MSSLYTGVRAVSDRIQSTEGIARRVVELAEQASGLGTFGVGGLLLTKSGQVFGEAINAVVQNGHVVDPTAHAERQLVDWLFVNGRGNLFGKCEEIVIASSLDPCAMCAGAILRAGVSVISLAVDEMSGVHGRSSEPLGMPSALRRQAASQMALFGIESYRPKAGADLGEIFRTPISSRLYHRAHDAFSASVDAIRGIVGGSLPWQSPVVSVGNRGYSEIVRKYVSHSPEFVWMTEDVFRRNIYNDWPHWLSCILEDDAGRIIMGVREEPDMRPTSSGVVRLIRAYSELRNAVPEELRAVLPHPRFCSIVINDFPNQDDRALFELGAIGSFMEEKRPSRARPALLYLAATDDRRPQEILQALPPFYTQIIELTVARARP